MNDEERDFLTNLGLSLDHLKLLRGKNLERENLYTTSFGDKPTRKGVEPKKFPKNWFDEVHIHYDWYTSLVDNGYIYLTCPLSGKIIRSNQSFYIRRGDRLAYYAYRFIGAEPFYLIMGIDCADKLYFPQHELILKFKDRRFDYLMNSEAIVQKLKVLMVTHWKPVTSYILRENKETALVASTWSNLGHYVLNDLSGLQYLSDIGVLSKVNKILEASFTYFKIDDVFPEIDEEKIVSLRDDGENLFKTIIENHYCAVRVSDWYITSKLSKRIYLASVKQVSDKVRLTVKAAKKSLFPLLWIQVRTNYRMWVSQIEGLSSIINKLSENYPKVGIVFVGNMYLTEQDEGNISAYPQIEDEKNTVDQIVAILPNTVTTYNLIGCSNYELVVWAKAIDLFITPAGSSGSAFISWVSKKPGVQHTNSKLYGKVETYDAHLADNVVNPVMVPNEYVIDVDDNGWYGGNYDIDWQVVYQEVIKLIQLIEKKP